MSKNKKQAQPVEQAQAIATDDTVQAVEAQDQAVVETVTDIEQPAEPDEPVEQAQADAGGYVVQWAIKLDGKRYGIGDDVQMTEEQAAPFLASGAIKAKE